MTDLLTRESTLFVNLGKAAASGRFADKMALRAVAQNMSDHIAKLQAELERQSSNLRTVLQSHQHLYEERARLQTELDNAVHDIEKLMDSLNAESAENEKLKAGPDRGLLDVKRYRALRAYYAGAAEGVAWFNEEHCDQVADAAIERLADPATERQS